MYKIVYFLTLSLFIPIWNPFMAPMAACALVGLSKLTKPKHLLWLVARSMNTLELITFPKGRNICISSASPNSWGRW